MTDYLLNVNERDYPVSNEQLDELDLIRVDAENYHLLHNGKAYHCQILSVNLETKEVSLLLNGSKQRVQLKDKIDQLVAELGLSVVTAQASNDIFAPMPGLVLDIMVEVGQEIEAGTPLLILEAMKMENVLKSEGAGIVKSITVSKGEAVEKRQLLIEIE